MAISELRDEDVAEDLVGMVTEYIDPNYFGEGESLEYTAEVDDSKRRVCITATDQDGNERHFELKVQEVVPVLPTATLGDES